MPDLLLELFSEEIPARMQTQAADDLRRLVTDAAVARGLTYEGAVAFATPRRLALHVAGLPARQPDTREERKGPRVGAPEAAVQGFLKSAGLASLDEARIDTDAKKGSFYVAVIEKAGRNTLDVLAEILPAVIRAFPWPKSMRWGADSAQPDPLRWVRPLHSIVATFGPETEEPQIVPFTIPGVTVGDTTYGHRFLSPGPIKVRRFDDYQPALDAAKVVLDPGRRRDIILHDARDLALAQGLELVEDDALLHEVAGLVEWPVVLLGIFDEAFLAIPPEVIRATIRANQKCFVLRQPDGTLANQFVITSNLVASDGGQVIAAGNARVVRARLSDAKFFWDTDRKTKLEERLPRLDSIVFHEKLGTQGERVKRIEALAGEIAKVIGADEAQTRRAAQLCKADLVSEMVGEFPELQGLMGRYYATEQGEPAAVAAAIEDHYKPQGPSDRVPSEPVSMTVALADKLDTLVGFWAIDEKPTGSKDPYALRRAALGVIRIVLENGLRLQISGSTTAHLAGFNFAWPFQLIESFDDQLSSVAKSLSSDLLAFFADRLKVYLRDKGARHDLIDAVFALPGQDDLLMIVRRVEALDSFLGTEDGKNLLAGYRRAANIVRIENKKTPGAADGAFDATRATLPEERALVDALTRVTTQVGGLVTHEDFAGAMQGLSTLRAPVDAFFDKVTVNDPNPALRINRLKLLTALRDAMHQVADFSRIVG